MSRSCAELNIGRIALGVEPLGALQVGDRGMSGETDQAVVERVRTGDLDAFSVLVDKYQDRVFSVVLNYVSNRDDAIDVVQDTFVKAYAKLPSFDAASAFYTWLYRIAVNTAIDLIRKKKGRNADSLDDEKYQQVGFEPPARDPSVDPERVAVRTEQAAIIRKAIGSLSHKLRAVAILHDVEGLSQEEVARILRIPVGTVKSRVSRARTELKDALKDLVGEAV